MLQQSAKFIRLFLAIIVIYLFAGYPAKADNPPLPGMGTHESDKFIRISGQFGAMSEFNTIAGRERRRPGSTGRLFLRPTISIYNTIDINLNLFLSTEGNGARQDLNQIDLNPKWGWGEAHLVDFTDSYSQFTLNGIKIRGAGLNLNPGLFRMSVISGISKREITGAEGTRSYRRQVNGGKIGIGREGGSFIDFIVLSAKDNFPPADSIVIDTTTSQDSTGFSGAQNPSSITPQANLVGAVVSNLFMAKRKLSWKNELAGSAFTRDRRSPEWEQKNYPGFLKSIFTPRLSTSVDLAYSAEIALNTSQYGFQVGYQYIGPGYVSLGLSSQSSDRQVIKLGINRRLKNGAVKLNFTRQNDNLIRQKSFTTNRNNINIGAVYKPVQIWNMNLNLTFVSMYNDAPDSSARVDFRNRAFQLGNTISFDREKGIRNISLDYSFQTSGDSDPAKTSSSLKSHNMTIQGLYSPYGNIGVIPTINIIDTRQADAGWTLTRSYNIGINIQSFDKRLNNNFTTGITLNGSTSSMKIGLRSSCKLTRSALLSAQIDTNHFKSDGEAGNFTETTARLTATQSF